jgi:hypothetical protein
MPRLRQPCGAGAALMYHHRRGSSPPRTPRTVKYPLKQTPVPGLRLRRVVPGSWLRRPRRCRAGPGDGQGPPQAGADRAGRDQPAAAGAAREDRAGRGGLIMDNGSSRTSRAIRAWLAAHPGITSHLYPRARVLAEHEQWFGVLTRKLLRRGDFTSRGSRNPDHRVRHPAQQASPAVQVELRRQRRARPLPRTPPPAPDRRPPSRSRMAATLSHQDPVRNL